MHNLTDFFYHFATERGQILWISAGYKSIINYYFLVNPFDTGVDQLLQPRAYFSMIDAYVIVV